MVKHVKQKSNIDGAFKGLHHLPLLLVMVWLQVFGVFGFLLNVVEEQAFTTLVFINAFVYLGTSLYFTFKKR